jgi:hypothetical protein
LTDWLAADVLARVVRLVAVVLLEVALEEVCGAGAANNVLLSIKDSANANIFFILCLLGESRTRSQSRAVPSPRFTEVSGHPML